MATVYVVIEGEYSDQNPVAVFTDKERADLWVELRGDGVVEVELDPEIPASPDAVRMGRNGYQPYQVGMLKDGAVSRAGRLWVDGPDWVLPGDRISLQSGQYTSLMGEGPPYHVLVCHAWARDREHAVKIANDRRAQLIAMGGWRDLLADVREQIEKLQTLGETDLASYWIKWADIIAKDRVAVG